MQYTRATADTLVRTGAGKLHTISIAPTTATPTAGLISVYDSLTEANTVIFSEWIFATTPGHTIEIEGAFRKGIYVGFDGTLANVSVTVCYTR